MTPFPAATPHGEIRQVLKDIYFVTGSVCMTGPMTMSFSRNMTIIRTGEELTLVNTVRLDDAGLRALDALGKVTDVVRLAGFHGMDDPFYKDRYNAKVWAVKGQIYGQTFDLDAAPAPDAFKPDVEMDEDTPLPIPNAKIYRFKSSRPAEALLYLSNDGGTIVSGDCLQNWHKTDRYFSIGGKLIMKLMGFIKPCNIGPGWLKIAKPDMSEIAGILDLKFDNVLPAHGAEVIGGAFQRYKGTIEKLAR